VLVLTRRKNEVIRIGDAVQVIVLAVNDNDVHLGIVAPQEVIVDREEVAKRKQRERDERAR
jgi:carbon storage regulator